MLPQHVFSWGFYIVKTHYLQATLPLATSYALTKRHRISVGKCLISTLLCIQNVGDCSSFKRPNIRWAVAPSAKVLKKPFKTLQLATAPQVLMLQLKRCSSVDCKTVKLDKLVECASTGLDMTRHLVQKVTAGICPCMRACCAHPKFRITAHNSVALSPMCAGLLGLCNWRLLLL